jgi:hypothetical protein
MLNRKNSQQFDALRIRKAFFLAPPIGISATVACITLFVLVFKIAESNPLGKDWLNIIFSGALAAAGIIIGGTLVAYLLALFVALPLFFFLKNRIYVDWTVCTVAGLFIGLLIEGFWAYGVFGAIIGYTFWRMGIRTIPEDAPPKQATQTSARHTPQDAP